MTSRETVLAVMAAQGRADALDLRSRAKDMDGTAIIMEEAKAPAWDAGKDYSDWPVGAPVADEGQVWTLIQPHNAAHYEGRPSTLRALWGLCHTTDPARAKPWVDPEGTSGMYMAGECYRAEDGTVYRCKVDNTVHDAHALPTAWEAVSTSVAEDPPEEASNTVSILDGMTVAQMKEYADNQGITLGGATKKADIRAAIEAAEAGKGTV